MFENPRRGTQARNFTTNVSKILDLKSSSEQIIIFRKLLLGAPVYLKLVRRSVVDQGVNSSLEVSVLVLALHCLRDGHAIVDAFPEIGISFITLYLDRITTWFLNQLI